MIETWEQGQAHLRSAAAKLHNDFATETDPRILGAINEISRLAEHLRPCNGDGPACPRTVDPVCTAGVLPFLASVEQTVRNSYLLANGFRPHGPVIDYKTVVLNGRQGSAVAAALRIQGETDTQTVPPVIELTLPGGNLTSADLCHLTYVGFHELVCHGFVGAASNAPKDNAFPSNLWAECWMDVVAFWIAERWVRSGQVPADWLSNANSKVIGSMREAQKGRYEAKTNANSLMRRQMDQAQEAIERLDELIEKYAVSTFNAETFLLAVNAHADAEVEKLEILAGQLQVLIFRKSWYEAGDRLTHICDNFVNTSDLLQLFSEVSAYAERIAP